MNRNKNFKNPDLHMHSIYSDGTDTPAALLKKVKAAGIVIGDAESIAVR